MFVNYPTRLHFAKTPTHLAFRLKTIYINNCKCFDIIVERPYHVKCSTRHFKPEDTQHPAFACWPPFNLNTVISVVIENKHLVHFQQKAIWLSAMMRQMILLPSQMIPHKFLLLMSVQKIFMIILQFIK